MSATRAKPKNVKSGHFLEEKVRNVTLKLELGYICLQKNINFRRRLLNTFLHRDWHSFQQLAELLLLLKQRINQWEVDIFQVKDHLPLDEPGSKKT
jgi:hypothetical protein